jgi:hypothetical protein
MGQSPIPKNNTHPSPASLFLPKTVLPRNLGYIKKNCPYVSYVSYVSYETYVLYVF